MSSYYKENLVTAAKHTLADHPIESLSINSHHKCSFSSNYKISLGQRTISGILDFLY